MPHSSSVEKERIAEVDTVKVFEALERLPIIIWRYKDEYADKHDDHKPHLGPMPEDLGQLFNIGDSRQLHFIDVIGIALAASQGAGTKIRALEKRLAELEATIEEFRNAEPVG